jgi:hypothetical protein
MTIALLTSTSATASAVPLDSTFGTPLSSARPVASTVAFSQLGLYPNIETIGVAVSGVGLPKTAQLMYRQSGESVWRTGHPLMRIDDGRLIGSLFELSPSTSYDIKVLDGATEIAGTIFTQADELQFTPSVILHVNDDAPAGGNGSVAAPFQTIQAAVNHAAAGTQVLVADGIYRESISFPASGTAGNWIQVRAQGTGAVLDSSNTLSGNIWTPHATKARVWFTKIGSSITYLARDQKRFYKYDDLSGLLQSVGHGDVTMNEGWFFDPSTLRLYVRSVDDPSSHTWRIPTRSYAIDVNSRDWLWIEGLEMRYYGAGTNGCGVCTLNASHIVIRRNKIHNIQLGIYVNWSGGEDRGNDVRIEYNEIYDPPVNEWPWNAVKGSSMEGTGIVVRGHIGAIVRGNNIHNFFNGIYTGSSGALENPELAFDADIYNNYIHDLSDDAFEPEGACINHRFRNNRVESAYAGISLAPVTHGPTWVLRSSFANYTGRGIKFALNSDGIVLIYHNTGWTTVGNVNAMDLITPVRNTVMRNNIFQSAAYSIAETPTGSIGNDWNYDNWYTTRGSSGPHFKWENVNYNNITALCAASTLECTGHESPPGLTNPSGGDFTLLSSSPNIDRGIFIPGINDGFAGNAPDVGAYEFTFDPPPTVLSVVRASSNPTNAVNVNFTVRFSESVTGVGTGAFAIVTSSGITGASVINVTPVSGTTYTVGVNTGSGDGTIQLDVIDNDNIIDSRGSPLGGVGAGNGNFTSGETYTISKTITASMTVTFKSTASYDGWMLESGENTSTGGQIDKSATVVNLGDNAKDKQYRSILSFNTNSLPDNAIITSVQLKIKRQGLVGTDPFVTHGLLLLEMTNGAFSSSAVLQVGDFSAAASQGITKDQISALTSSWYAAMLSQTNLGFINKYGVTQFRIRFSKDDNDDLGADYMKFYSGNSISTSRPQLIVIYYVP